MEENYDIFKKLTVDSIKQIYNRVAIKKLSEIQKIKDNEDNLHDELIKDKCSKKVQADRRFITGRTLPDRIKKRFPPELIGVPIEEIDEFHVNDLVSFFYAFNDD